MTLMVLFNQNFLSDSFVTFVKSNAKALLTFHLAATRQKRIAPCGAMGLRPAAKRSSPAHFRALQNTASIRRILERSKAKVKTLAAPPWLCAVLSECRSCPRFP